MEPIYDGPERRTSARGPFITKRSMGVTFIAMWLAIMVPLGFTLRFASRADDRAERATNAICELVPGVGHLADTVDGVLVYALADDDGRAAAIANLRRLVEQGDKVQAAAAKACLEGGGP